MTIVTLHDINRADRGISASKTSCVPFSGQGQRLDRPNLGSLPSSGPPPGLAKPSLRDEAVAIANRYLLGQKAVEANDSANIALGRAPLPVKEGASSSTETSATSHGDIDAMAGKLKDALVAGTQEQLARMKKFQREKDKTDTAGLYQNMERQLIQARGDLWKDTANNLKSLKGDDTKTHIY